MQIYCLQTWAYNERQIYYVRTYEDGDEDGEEVIEVGRVRAASGIPVQTLLLYR